MTVSRLISVTLAILVSASLLASCGSIKGEEDITASGTTVKLSGYASGTTLTKPSTGDAPSMAAVTGAVVQILTFDGKQVGTTTTDSSGLYTVSVTKGENYIVRVSKGNVVLKAIVITPGADITVDVTPRSSAIVRVLADNLGNSSLGEVNVDVSGQVDLINLDALISAIVSNTDFDDLVTAIEAEISSDGDYDDDSGDTVGDGGSYSNITIIVVVVNGDGGDGGTDSTPPSSPVVTSSSYKRDTTPTWNWTSGGGGIGTFRYKLADSDLTTGATYTVEHSYTPTSVLSRGTYTFYVQERDIAGNWSESGSKTFTLHGWTNEAPMPNVRYLPRKVVVDGIVYFIGGRDAYGNIDSVEAYDPTTDTWTTKTAMPVAIGASPWAEVVNGIIYVIRSGHASSDPIPVYAYDPATDIWTTKTSIPTTRNFFLIGQSNGLIYAIGGSAWCGPGCFSPTDEDVIEVYDPATDSWSTIAHTGTTSNYYTHAQSLSSGDMIFMSNGGPFGGRHEYFDTSTNHIASVPAVSIDGRSWGGYSTGIFLIDNQVFMMMSNGPIAELDHVNNTWINAVLPPTLRGEAQALLFNNEIFLIGGYTLGASGVDSTIVEAFDPATNSWSTKPSLLKPKYIYKNGLSLDGKIYIFGGIDRAAGGTFLKTVEAYQ